MKSKKIAHKIKALPYTPKNGTITYIAQQSEHHTLLVQLLLRN